MNHSQPPAQKDYFRRTANEWHPTSAGQVLLHFCWTTNSDRIAEPLSGYLKRFCTDVLGTSPPPDAVLGPSLFSTLAMSLQCASSPFLREWLFRRASPHLARRYRYPAIDEAVGAAAGAQAARVMLALIGGSFDGYDDFRVKAEALIDKAQLAIAHIAPRESGYRVLAEAIERGIPVRRRASTIPVYQLGYGCRQRRLWQGFTSATTHIGTALSARKHHTNVLLREHDFPVPAQQLVTRFEQARRAALRIGYPVVVKPAATDRGTAVSTNIGSEVELRAAFDLAAPFGMVIVEKHIPGSDYRMAVIGGRCTAVFRRDPAQVIGDGRSTIEALLRIQAQARLRDPVLRTFPVPSLDDPSVLEMLRRQGLGGNSIAAAGQVVPLRGNANVSTGGTLELVTADVHPDNISMAERIADCVGLDHAGIDFITPDITRPWHEIACGVCEVNATPAMFLPGDNGLMIDYLFPPGADGRIPIAVVIGTGAEADAAFQHVVDLGSTLGLRIGAVRHGTASIGGVLAARNGASDDPLGIALADSGVELAVAQLSPEELLRNGIRTPYVDAAAYFLADEDVEKVRRSPVSRVGDARIALTRPKPEALAALLASELTARKPGSAV